MKNIMKCLKNVIHRWNHDVRTIRITTTSVLAVWTPSGVVSSGTPLWWNTGSGGSVWATQSYFYGDLPTLDLSGNSGSGWLFARDCRNITQLNVPAKDITEVDLDNAPLLSYLSLSSNSLTSIDTDALTELVTLHLHYNNLNTANIDFQYNTKLQTLYIDHNTNWTTAPDLTDLTDLRDLKFHYNNMGGTIDLSQCTLLTGIICNQNNLTSLDVTTLTLLQSLNASSNNFSGTFSTTGLTVLYNLNITNNSISSFDLSTNVALQLLNVSLNSLTTLDISNNTALTTLNVYTNNSLTTLDVGTNTLLTYVRCHGTNLSDATQDQIYIDLDNHGLSNGTLWIDSHSLSGAAATAKTNLEGKGWTITTV